MLVGVTPNSIPVGNATSPSTTSPSTGAAGSAPFTDRQTTGAVSAASDDGVAIPGPPEGKGAEETAVEGRSGPCGDVQAVSRDEIRHRPATRAADFIQPVFRMHPLSQDLFGQASQPAAIAPPGGCQPPAPGASAGGAERRAVGPAPVRRRVWPVRAALILERAIRQCAEARQLKLGS